MLHKLLVLKRTETDRKKLQLLLRGSAVKVVAKRTDGSAVKVQKYKSTVKVVAKRTDGSAVKVVAKRTDRWVNDARAACIKMNRSASRERTACKSCSTCSKTKWNGTQRNQNGTNETETKRNGKQNAMERWTGTHRNGTKLETFFWRVLYVHPTRAVHFVHLVPSMWYVTVYISRVCMSDVWFCEYSVALQRRIRLAPFWVM